MSAKKMVATLDKTSDGFQVDSMYEFAAPKFFDFAANLKDSGSIKDDQSEVDHEWFETHQSPCTPGVTPRRPVKLYYSSGSKKCPSSASSRTISSDVLIPGTHERGRKLSSPHSASASSDWKDIPSPLTNALGLELDNCDALLAELGLSPMPQKINKSTRVSPRRASPSRKRRSSPRKKTPAKTRKGSVQPSPLRNQIGRETTESGRNSLYKKLFQMKPKRHKTEEIKKVGVDNFLVQQKAKQPPHQHQSKTSTVSAKLRVGADLLPAKSVKPLTVPREFSFATDQRLKRSISSARLGTSMSPASVGEKRMATNRTVSRQVRPPTQPMSPKFSKRIPMVRPEKISQPLSAAVKKTVAPPRLAKVTIPKSPNFSTARPRKSHINPLAISAQTSFLSTPFKARPAPKFGKPFEPVRPHRHTVPKDMRLPGDHGGQSKRLKLESDRKETEIALSQLALHTPVRKTPGITAEMNSSTPKMAPKPYENQENQPRSNLLPAKKITIPRSPKFSTSTRIRQRHLANQP